VSVIRKTDWQFVFWNLRYIIGQMVTSKLTGFFIAITLSLSFLLHDSDIARIGIGLVRGETAYWLGYITVSLSYFMSIADPLFRRTNLAEFTASLPFKPPTKIVSSIAVATIAQIPMLYFASLTVYAALGFSWFLPCLMLLLWLGNIVLLTLAKVSYHKITTLVKSFDLSTKILHILHFDWSYLTFLNVVLFLRCHRASYLRDFLILLFIVMAFYILRWNQDLEAINFIFFVFACFFISLSRYVNLFKDIDDEETAYFWQTLPISSFERLSYQFLASFILILPFLAAYLALTSSLLRAILLFIMQGFFLSLRRALPKYSSYINIVVAIAVFSFIRYRL